MWLTVFPPPPLSQMKRPGNGGGSNAYNQREQQQQQMLSDEELAWKLFEEEEREEQKRVAQEKADAELAKRLAELPSPQQAPHTTSPPPPPPLLPPPPPPPRQQQQQHPIEVGREETDPIVIKRSQVEADELLAISLYATECSGVGEGGSSGNSGSCGSDSDDQIQCVAVKRPKVVTDDAEMADNDRKASMLIANVRDELRMPEVNIHALLCEFSRTIFSGKLESVSISWSKQMKLCAGICKYHYGGFCEVRLSEPLLKFRPRNDFLDTLLHEMIHAYCTQERALSHSLFDTFFCSVCNA